MRELRRCLADYSVARLRALAAARGLELTTHKRLEAARQLAETMLRPDAIAEVLEILNVQERVALQAIQAAGGSVRADPFVRRFGGIRAVGDGRLIVEQPWLAPATPTERLWYLGLLFKAFADYRGERVAHLFIPSDLLPLLPSPQTQGGLPCQQVGEPARLWRAGDSAALDVCALLAHLQNHQPRFVRGRGLSTQDERTWRNRWAATAIEPAPFAGYEDLRARFLLRMAARLRLARRAGDHLRPSADAARLWLNGPRSRQMGQLWAAWLNDAGWDELRRIPEIRCEGVGWNNDPALARQRLLELLSACEPGAWYGLSEITRSIREHAPDFQRTGGDYDSWYIRDVKSGEYLMGFNHWDAVEGRLIAQIIAGPMHWLGAADLGWDESGQELLFSPTAMGWAWLRGQEAGGEEPLESVQISADAQIRWPANGNLYHRFQLERLAEWQGNEDGTAYAITPASLARVLAQGVGAQTIIGFLQRASDGQLPPEVAARIAEWAGRRGLARLSRAMLLQTDSPKTMAEIQADPDIRPRLGELISPTCVRVPESEWREVLSILRKKGFVL